MPIVHVVMPSRSAAHGRPDPAASPETPSTRPLRTSPQNTQDRDPNASTAPKSIPYRTLLQIPSVPKPATPTRRASSAGPASHRGLRRTPAAQARTPSAAQRLGGSARRPNVMTPHGRAAVREVEARRAGLTPGQERRRSGRQQRETPRDTLRALSRLLAPKTKPVVPTPPAPAAPTGRFAIPGSEDFDDGPDLERPRLSLPLGEEDEEDDSLLLPPRSAGLEDENFTVRSVELPRRAISELPPGRLSRGSFGSIRMSDQFGDLNESGLDGVGGVFDSSFAMGGPYRDDDVPDMDDGFEGDNTATLRDIGLRRGRLSLASGRDSDIRPGMLPGDDTENTFVFTVPPRDVPDLQQSDDTVESPNQDDGENDWAEVNEDAERWNAMHEDVEMAIPEGTLEDANTVTDPAPRAVRKKRIKISKHGIPYPSLPPGVVKKLATTYARTSGNSKAKISKDTLEAIMQASDWFFEQVSDDLGAYAEHAGRKTIEERDVVTLMGRQRQTNTTTTPFSLAQRFLPRELLQELRMVPPSKIKSGQLEQVDEVDEE